MRLCCAALLLLSFALPATPPPSSPAYQSAKRKVDAIQDDRAPANTTYSFTKAEIEAWGTAEAAETVPEGFRNPRVELGNGVATGRALIDFMKLRHAKGAPKNWFIDRILEGERPVTVTVRVESANRMCTVHLMRLEISGIAATGTVLDFLIKNFFLTLYPDAKIGKPFELQHRMERIEVRPNAAYIKITNVAPPKNPSPVKK